MVVDPIFPLSRGGPTVFENLCFSCHRCNGQKGITTHRLDPLTGQNTRLYHPRTDKWGDHFRWDNDGLYLLALSAIGRVTLLTLPMNNDEILDARRKWVSVGWHP